jgi:hypothetical protein
MGVAFGPWDWSGGGDSTYSIYRGDAGPGLFRAEGGSGHAGGWAQYRGRSASVHSALDSGTIPSIRMKPIPINIAVEDLLSETVARRLLADSGRDFAVGVVYNRGGNGYLRKTAKGWNSAAKSTPFFLLTDLDSVPCPSLLRSTWLSASLHPNFIFRVAVREVESWLLADRHGLSSFLRVPKTSCPEQPDDLSDAKASLVALASRSPLNVIKTRIVPRAKSTAKQGRDYNGCLSDFVMTRWNPSEAALSSPSLDRCRRKLASFAPLWGK